MNAHQSNQVNLKESQQLQQPENSSPVSKKALLISLCLLVLTAVGFYSFSAWNQNTEQQLQQLEKEPSSEKTKEKIQVNIQDVSSANNDLPKVDEKIKEPVVKDTRLTIESSKDTYQSGQTANFIVKLSASQQPDGVQFVIDYDPASLTNVTAQAVNEFGNIVTSQVDQQKGRIKLVLLRNPSEVIKPSADMKLLEIKGLIASSNQFSLNFDLDKTKVSAKGGQSILKQAEDLTINLTKSQ